MALAEGKSKVLALVLCFFLGMLGIHNFYLGQTKSGIGKVVLFILSSVLAIVGIGFILYLLLGLWVLIDFIKIIIK